MGRKKAAAKGASSEAADGARIYTLEVVLLEGIITKTFHQANPVVSRTIVMRGDQTLEHFHYAIEDAFDRDDEHLYEFQFGKRPMDRNGDRYVRFDDFGDDYDEPTGTANKVRLDDLELKTRRRFFYWFDFGDSWWHSVKVVSIKVEAPEGRYPRVVARVGASPPQYLSEDEYDDLA